MLQEKHATLSVREKMLVLCSVIILVLFVAVNFFIEPLYNDFTALKKQQDNTKQSIDATQLQIDNIDSKLAADPLAQIQLELDALNNKHAEQLSRLENFRLSLVSSDQMSGLVRELVNENKHLSVESLKSLTPKVILYQDNDETKPALLYKHTMMIELKGRYFALLDFMKRIESKERSVLWSDINYRVEVYPEAVISFEIYTISADKEFIGVKS